MGEGLQQSQNRGQVKAAGKETEKEKDRGTPCCTSGELNKSQETFEVTICWAGWVSKKQNWHKKLIYVLLPKLGTAPHTKACGKPEESLSTLLIRAEPLKESAGRVSFLVHFHSPQRITAIYLWGMWRCKAHLRMLTLIIGVCWTALGVPVSSKAISLPCCIHQTCQITFPLAKTVR